MAHSLIAIIATPMHLLLLRMKHVVLLHTQTLAGSGRRLERVNLLGWRLLNLTIA